MTNNAYLEPLAAVLEPLSEAQRTLIQERAARFLERERIVTYCGIKTYVRDFMRDANGEIRMKSITEKDAAGADVTVSRPMLDERFVMQIVDVSLAGRDPVNERRTVFGIVPREAGEVDVYSFEVGEVQHEGETKIAISFFVATYARAATQATLSPNALAEEMRLYFSSEEELEADDEGQMAPPTNTNGGRTSGAGARS